MSAGSKLKAMFTRLAASISRRGKSPNVQDTDGKEFDPRNFTEDAIRKEFKYTFLPEVALSNSEIFAFERPAAAQFAGLVIMMISTMGGPMAILGGGAVTGRLLQASGKALRHLREAGLANYRDLISGSETRMAHVDEWLDKNSARLTGFLEKKEQAEINYRRAKKLIDLINKSGTADFVTAADRVFLRQQGCKNLTVPVPEPFQMPNGRYLGLRHTSLEHALRKDISARAGAKGSVLRQALFLAR
jgi:hypothetical protein